MKTITRYAPLLMLLIGLVGVSAGATILRSATAGADSDTAVLRQQIQDYIGDNDKRINESTTRIDALQTKLEEINSEIAGLEATQKMTNAEQDKIIYALWAMVSGIVALFCERIFTLVGIRKRV